MTTSTSELAPDNSIEELAFLARSPHRVQLLLELSREERTRRDLGEAADISKPTLGRILGDFERRHWISNQHNGAYTLTPLGALLSDSVEDLLDVIHTIEGLAGLAQHLPWDRLDFDTHHLTEATIVTPSSSDPLAHMRRFDALAADATTVRMFSNVISCAPAAESIEADREFLRDVDELVVTSDAIVTDADDPELRDWLRRQVGAGDLALYSSEQPADLLFGIFDETVGIVPVDDTGMPAGLIEAETAPIRSWVTETFEAYRRNSTRLTAESLSN